MNVKDVHTKAEGTNANKDENGVELKNEMGKRKDNIFGAIENFNKSNFQAASYHRTRLFSILIPQHSVQFWSGVSHKTVPNKESLARSAYPSPNSIIGGWSVEQDIKWPRHLKPPGGVPSPHSKQDAQSTQPQPRVPPSQQRAPPWVPPGNP